MMYKIEGKPYSVLILDLENGESIKCQNGGMSFKSPNMVMETKVGKVGKVFSRLVGGESMFLNVYTATGGSGTIGIGTSCPGDIIPIKISQSNQIIAQKGAFLAAEPGVNYEIFFRKKLSSGFFGGEGFIMQKFTGNGMLFIENGGSTIDYDLSAGQSIILDTGYLLAMSATCSMEVETIQGFSNVLFGGEGLFNTKITGPGHVWIQTMPLVKIAESITPFIKESSD